MWNDRLAMVSQDGRLGQQSTSPRVCQHMLAVLGHDVVHARWQADLIILQATTMRRSTIGPRQGRSGVNESAAQVLSELLTSLSLTTGGDKRSTGLGTLSTMMCIVTCVLIPVQVQACSQSPLPGCITVLTVHLPRRHSTKNHQRYGF